MLEEKLVDTYLKKLEEKSDCKIKDQVSARKYCFSKKNKSGKFIRYLMDDNLDAGILDIGYKKDLDIDYIEGGDLLIIGFCLTGKKIIDHFGRHTIEEGEAFYFRPGKDYKLKLFESEFIYFFLDLTYFKDYIYCGRKNCQCKREDCTSYVDNICEKGEIVIKRQDYIMDTYREDIRKIKKTEIHNFLDYTNLKGDLFKYLNLFIKSRMTAKRRLNKKKYGLCYAEKAKKIIWDNKEEDLSVKEIAEILGISVYRLQKSFRRREGTTVYNYILNEKIKRGKILLEESTFSIMDISLRVGYENPSKFSTAFKNITGLTPSEYRKSKLD